MTRQEAIEQGAKTYHGKPCKNCASTEKFVTSWGCVSCTTKRTAERSPEVFKKYASSDKGRDRAKRYRQSQPYKDTQSRYVLKDYQKNPHKYKMRNIKHTYGISEEHYHQLLETQQHRCAVCQTHKDELKNGLCIDHNHTTNEVRALLCGKCNVAIGMVDESTDRLLALISYLEKYQ